MSEEQYLSTDDSDWEYTRLSVDSESNSIDVDSVETIYRSLSGAKIVEKQSAVVEDDMKRRTCWVDLRTEGKWKVINNCLMWECKKCKPRTSYSSLADLICHTVKDHQKTLTFQCNTCCQVLEDNALAEHFASHSEISASLYDAIKEDNETETEDMTNENVDEEPVASEYSFDTQFKDEDGCNIKYIKNHDNGPGNNDSSIDTNYIDSVVGRPNRSRNLCSKYGKPLDPKQHFDDHDEMKNYRDWKHLCASCGKGFIRKDELTVHSRTHTGEKPYNCNSCDKCFADRRNLTRHLRTHTGQKPFQCTYCPTAFNQTNALKAHLAMHLKAKQLKCPICCEHFDKYSMLKRHVLQHSKPLDFNNTNSCQVCGNFYTDFKSLKQHSLLHTEQSPKNTLYKGLNVCDICNTVSSTPSALKLHIKTHTKPFKCAHCTQAFSTQALLRIHTRLHTGDRPFKCTQCSKSFTSQLNLSNHQIVHNRDLPFACSICEKEFVFRSSLRKHVRKHNNNQIESNVQNFH